MRGRHHLEDLGDAAASSSCPPQAVVELALKSWVAPIRSANAGYPAVSLRRRVERRTGSDELRRVTVVTTTLVLISDLLLCGTLCEDSLTAGDAENKGKRSRASGELGALCD